MAGTVAMRKRNVPITVEVPLDLAEFLAQHGDQLVRAVQDAVAAARKAAKAEDWRELERDVARRREIRHAKVTRDGRSAHRTLRQRLAGLPEDVKGKERKAIRNAVIGRLADELGFSFHYLEFAIREHRRTLLRRVRDRRKLWVLRYLLRGMPSAEIADHVGVKAGTVEHDVSDLRREAKAAGQPLIELEQTKSRRRASAGAVPNDDNVIYWAEVKAAGGRP